MLDVGFFERKKIAALPWRRQIGFIYVLTRAKLQDREGVFASRAVLKVTAGVFRDGVDDWMESGLLHDAAALCDKCVVAFPLLDDGNVAVHDWHEDQVSRTTSWRLDKALDETPGGTPVEQPGNTGETVVKHPSRARVTRFLVPSSETVTTEGVQGEPFPAIDADAQTFLEGITGRLIRQAGDKQLAEYDRQIADHGLAAVIKAYQRCARAIRGTPTATQLVWSGRKILEPFVDAREVVDAERAAPRPRIVKPPVDEKARNDMIRQMQAGEMPA